MCLCARARVRPRQYRMHPRTQCTSSNLQTHGTQRSAGSVHASLPNPHPHTRSTPHRTAVPPPPPAGLPARSPHLDDVRRLQPSQAVQVAQQVVARGHRRLLQRGGGGDEGLLTNMGGGRHLKGTWHQCGEEGSWRCSENGRGVWCGVGRQGGGSSSTAGQHALTWTAVEPKGGCPRPLLDRLRAWTCVLPHSALT